MKKEDNSSQEQIHDILFSREIGWQEIIYDLINTEQLDPWDINITILTDKYLERIRELEEDFFVSSKVLLAAALLLRIKSEILLNQYIKSVDEILFGKKQEQIKIDDTIIEIEDEIPHLIPRSPIPRFRRVTLNELIQSLDKAITTENRRIKKEITHRNALRETSISLPKRKFNPKSKSKEIYQKLREYLTKDEETKRVAFSELVKGNIEERVISFLLLLQMENQKKIWLEQESHFSEIYIWPRKAYFRYNPDPLEEIKRELEQIEEEIEDKLEREKKRKNSK